MAKLRATLRAVFHATKALSRLTPQFSGRALPHVTWHFIHHGPLQLLVRRLPQRSLPHAPYTDPSRAGRKRERSHSDLGSRILFVRMAGGTAVRAASHREPAKARHKARGHLG